MLTQKLTGTTFCKAADKLTLVTKICKINTHAKPKPTGHSSSLKAAHISVHCRAWNSPDNLPSYAPDNSHSSDVSYIGGEMISGSSNSNRIIIIKYVSK